MKKFFFLDFYTKITLWGSLGNKLMGKKQIWAKKYFWGVMGPPSKKMLEIQGLLQNYCISSLWYHIFDPDT